MRCPYCGQEVALNKTCPYCLRSIPVGENVKTGAQENSPLQDTTPEEGFRGRISGEDHPSSPRGLKKAPALIRYFLDPRVPWLRKVLLIGGLLYLFFPFDFIPDLLPMVGWVDDAAVLTAWWAFLTRELQHYRP